MDFTFKQTKLPLIRLPLVGDGFLTSCVFMESRSPVGEFHLRLGLTGLSGLTGLVGFAGLVRSIPVPGCVANGLGGFMQVLKRLGISSIQPPPQASGTPPPLAGRKGRCPMGAWAGFLMSVARVPQPTFFSKRRES